MLSPGARDAIGRRTRSRLMTQLHDVQGRLDALKRRLRELAEQGQRVNGLPSPDGQGDSNEHGIGPEQSKSRDPVEAAGTPRERVGDGWSS